MPISCPDHYSYSVQDLQEVERLQPDLIILDYIFNAERSGWQMLQKLKMRRSTESIPVEICTAAKKTVEEMEGYVLPGAAGSAAGLERHVLCSPLLFGGPHL